MDGVTPNSDPAGPPASSAPPHSPPFGHSRARLVAGAILDLVLSLVLTVILMAPVLVGILTLRGDLHRETWTFERVPPDDAGLISWIGSQRGHRAAAVRRDGARLELAYRQTVLAQPARIPWTQLVPLHSDPARSRQEKQLRQRGRRPVAG